LRERLSDIRAAGAELIAVDPHEDWASKALLKETGFTTDQLNYPLLADPSLTVSATYGVAFQMRIHVEVSNRPATFVIDKGGVIRWEKRARIVSDRADADDVLRELKKLP